MKNNNEEWDLVITPKSGLFDINFKEIYQYKDLMFLLVKRDWDAAHKQTILGPLWTIVQPLFMTVVFSLIFTKVGKISTNSAPPALFYMCGLLPWNLFNSSFGKTSSTFSANAGLFGKVYFPRFIVPLASIFSSLIIFAINLGVFLLFLAVGAYNGFIPNLNLYTFLVPLFVVITLLFSLGTGFLISSLTIKYRDLNFLVAFGIQLFMYATPIIYPLSQVPEKYKWIILMNPLAAPVEGFRIGLLGVGDLSIEALIYSSIASVALFVTGMLVFNRTEKTFIDSI